MKWAAASASQSSLHGLGARGGEKNRGQRLGDSHEWHCRGTRIGKMRIIGKAICVPRSSLVCPEYAEMTNSREHGSAIRDSHLFSHKTATAADLPVDGGRIGLAAAQEIWGRSPYLRFPPISREILGPPSQPMTTAPPAPGLPWTGHLVCYTISMVQ